MRMRRYGRQMLREPIVEQAIATFDWQRMLMGDAPPLYLLEIVLRDVIFHGNPGIVLHAPSHPGLHQPIFCVWRDT